jgi:hypothetical protein
MSGRKVSQAKAISRMLSGTPIATDTSVTVAPTRSPRNWNDRCKRGKRREEDGKSHDHEQPAHAAQDPSQYRVGFALAFDQFTGGAIAQRGKLDLIAVLCRERGEAAVALFGEHGNRGA